MVPAGLTEEGILSWWATHHGRPISVEDHQDRAGKAKRWAAAGGRAATQTPPDVLARMHLVERTMDQATALAYGSQLDREPSEISVDPLSDGDVDGNPSDAEASPGVAEALEDHEGRAIVDAISLREHHGPATTPPLASPLNHGTAACVCAEPRIASRCRCRR